MPRRQGERGSGKGKIDKSAGKLGEGDGDASPDRRREGALRLKNGMEKRRAKNGDVRGSKNVEEGRLRKKNAFREKKERLLQSAVFAVTSCGCLRCASARRASTVWTGRKTKKNEKSRLTVCEPVIYLCVLRATETTKQRKFQSQS